MKKNCLKFSFVLIFAAAIFLPAAFAHATDCSSFTNLFNINSSNITGSNVNTTNPASQVHVFCSAGDIFTFVLNLLFEFTGVVAVIFIILGGFWFMTSAGNEERAEKGRKTLINAIIGLVVIILAATIVRIVVNTITGGGSSGSTTTTTTNNSSNNGSSASGNNNQAQPVSTAPTDPSGIIQSLSYLLQFTPNPPVVTSSFVISINLASSDYTKLQSACSGQPLAQLDITGVKTVNFTNQNNAYIANFYFNANELPVGNYQTHISICSVNVPNLTQSFAVTGTFGN